MRSRAREEGKEHTEEGECVIWAVQQDKKASGEIWSLSGESSAGTEQRELRRDSPAEPNGIREFQGRKSEEDTMRRGRSWEIRRRERASNG